MNVEHLRRRFLRNPIFAVWVALSILLVTSGAPFGSTDQGLAAQQSTTVTFVKNIGQTTEIISAVNNVENRVGYHLASRLDVSQALGFTTGTSSGGYTLESLTVEILASSGSTSYVPGITIHTDSSGLPATAALYTLTAPSPLPTGTGTTESATDGSVLMLEMTAPAAATLTARTTYWVVFKNTATQTSVNRYEINPTTAPAEDSGGLTGWSIADMRHRSENQGTAWTASTGAFQMELKGTEAEDLSGVTVTPTELTITEGMNDTYTVALDSAPSEQVTVTPTVPAGLSISPTSLTFSSTDFAAKSLTVTAEHDKDLVSATGLRITHAVSGYGEIITADAVTVNVTDDDAAGITVNPETLAVNEGMTETYTVVLDFQPAADVTVTPSVTANRGLTLDPPSLTFTTSDWETPQEVTVTAVEDANRANEEATITHTAAESGSGMAYDLAASAIDDISVTVNDNDVISLSATSLPIAEGLSEPYTVVLAQAPSSTVTVTLTLSEDSSVTVDTDPTIPGVQHTLSFTSSDWSTAQTVTVVAPEDDDGFSNVGTITHMVSGGGLRGSANLSTTVTDNDPVGLVVGGNATYNEQGDFYAMQVTEGTDSGQFTFKLASQPYPSTEDVIFMMNAPADSGLTFKKQGETTGSAMLSLTFTGDNWNTAQTVTVGVAHDDDTSDVTYPLTIGLSGANYVNPTAGFDFLIDDDDSPGLVISASVIEIDETDVVVTDTYTVNLLTKPSAAVTVTLTSPSNTDVTVDTDTVTIGDQLTLDFTPTNWNTAQTVTVKVAADATADDESATIVHTTSQTGGTEMEYASVTGDVSVNVDDDEVATIPAPPATLSMTENADGTVTGPTMYQLRLDTPPTSPVTITMTVAAVTPALIPGSDWTNPDISVTQSVVLDKNTYMTGKTVTITLSTDRDAEDDVARIDYTVTQSAGAMEYDGFSIASSTVNIADPEQAQILFSQDSGLFYAAPGLIMEDGDLLQLRVRLSHLPRGAVTVSVNFPSGSGLSAEMSSSVTFSAGGINATMPLNIEHAGDDDSFSQEYRLDFTVTGYGEGTVEDLTLTLTVEDKDDIDSTLDPSDGMVDVTEGATSTYKIKLASRPSTSMGTPGTVSVAITSNNSEVTVNPPTVTLNSGNWQDGVTVTVRAAEDADGVEGTATLTHVATSVSGGQNGDYNNVAIAPVTVTVMDNDPLGVIITPLTLEFLEETGTGTYTINLATAPTSTVLVTINDPIDNPKVVLLEGGEVQFNSSNYDTPRHVPIYYDPDVDTVDEIGTFTHTVTQMSGDREYDGLTAEDVVVTVTDPDRSEAVLKVSDSEVATLTVLEEGTATYGISLSHQPASGDTLTVELTVTGSGTPVTVEPTSLTFTSSDWDTSKTVTVTGVADANLVNDTFTVAHIVSGTRANTTAKNLQVTRTDNDSPNLDLGGTSALTITEGASASYAIKLTQLPSATVTLTVTATGNDDVRFSTDSCSTLVTSRTLEFTTTSWDSTQSLTVCGAEDYNATNDAAALTYRASGGGYGSLNYPNTPVTVTDNDTEGVTINPTSVPITEAEGGVAIGTYDVTLSAAPTVGNATVTMAVPNNSDVTTSPTSLTFSLSDWTSAMTQSVTKSVEIRVADDDGADDETAQITHTLSGRYASGTTLQSVTVNITDTDTRGVTITAADPISFNEGGSASYTVVLDTEPTGPVRVSVEDADTTDEIQADVTAVEFTIANWDTPQTVRVSAARDEDAQDDTGTITHTVTGADYEANNVMADSVDVTINDLDTRSVILRIGGVDNPTSPAFSIGEGAAEVEYEIRLGTKPVEADNTDGDVTVTVTTSNPSELRIRDLSNSSVVDSLTLSFDASNWNRYQTVTILAPDEPGDTSQDMATIMHAVAGADYGANSVTADPIQVTINDDDSPSFSTSAPSLNVTEGTSGSYTVSLDTLPVGGNVTITITVGTNPDIRLVDATNNDVTELALPFTTSDWDTAQTVTVRVAEDKDALEDSGTIRHVASGANFEGSVPDVTMRVEVQETTVANVGVDPTRLTVTEGRTGSYDLVLESEPQSNVVITVSSSNSSKAMVTPERVTFTNLTWSVPQTITVTGVADADANNDMAVVSHVSSGDIYDGLAVAPVNVSIIEDGTAFRDTSSFLQGSSCEGEVRLTWNSPTAEGVTVASYQIQWRAGKEQYSTSKSVTATADATSYTLTSLTNGVSYTIRVLGVDTGGEPVWSRETTATPSAQSCITAVRFGNILADSTPVIIDVGGAEPGTMVNMRYRSLNPGVWSDVQSKALEREVTTVTFDIRGLEPEHDYEVQTWLGNNRPPVDDRSESAPMAVAQKIFRTTSLPEGVTFVGGGGGGSVARIGRIEPSIRSVKMSAGDEVALSIEVWGRQGLLDNSLAEKAPSDGRPVIEWTSSGAGTFSEGRVRSEWRDDVANDRQVAFVAPSEPGTVTLTASLVDSADCLAQQEDESSEEHEVRCSAQIEVTVVRRATAPIIETAPVNPPGVIPVTLSDDDGVAYAVLTPVEGGSFVGDGYSLEAGAGAVSNGEYIGVSMAPAGDASNVGMTWHRYTLAGQRYVISVVDADRVLVSDYALNKAVTACAPLPSELRGNIADIVLAAADDAGGTTVLSTSVKITPDGVSVCGKLSTLPATVAVGKAGSPPEVVDPSEDDVAEEPLPDTGGAAPSTPWLLYLLLAGLVATVAGLTAMRRVRCGF